MDIKESSAEEHIILGDAFAREGRFPEARAHFEKAVERAPNNIQARTGLGNILVVLGQQQKADQNLLDAALLHLQAALEQNPDHYVALLNAGKAYKMRGNNKEAIGFFEKSSAIRPELAQPHLWLGTIYTEEKRYTHAVTHLKKTIEIDPNLAEAHMTLGLVYLAQSRVWASLERLNLAIHELEEVLRINPRRTDALMELGMAYHYCERNPEALECYRKLVELEPGNAKAHFYYGTLLAKVGEPALAIAHFAIAVEQQPDFADAYVSKAMVHEQLNQLEEAQKTIENGLKNAGGDARLLMPHAKVLSRSKKYDEALEVFNKLLAANVLTLKEQGFVQNEIAKIYDKLKRYDEAFDMFSKAQQTFAATFESKQHDPEVMRSNFRACRKWYTKERLATWDRFETHDGLKSPIFIMGFPRSGTTLMETILGSHPALVTTQERPILADLLVYLRDMLGPDIVYPQVLQTLTFEQILALRQRYKERAQQLFEEDIGDRIVVDKLPLNIPHLGLIQRIYPESKIVVMLRDPRDSCLSAFMQSFQVNIAMANFYSMESTVQFYNIVMDLWLHYRDIISLDWQELRYEDVVEDLEGHARTLFDFLGLAWDNQVLEYYKKAQGQHIRTPSYSGVVQPIYKSAAQRWKQYAKHMEPFQPQLARYVAEFGYEAE